MGTEARILVSIIIVFVLIVQWCWDLPADSVAARLIKPAKPWLSRLGFGHTWMLFAPNPPAGGATLRFEIEGRDGNRYVVPYPPEPWPTEWGRPHTRLHKARQSLSNEKSVRYQRSFSGWLVDEYLPGGPAEGQPWVGPARVTAITTRQLPPPFAHMGGPPQAVQQGKLFVVDLVARDERPAAER